MARIINEGDYVLLFLDRKRSYLVRIEREKKFHTHKGFVHIDELLGKEYGSKITSSLDVDFFAFKPTLTDYVFKTQRRTQILYPKDIALIIILGNIQPGSRVVEAGTGTGALTMALANYVKPSGRVYTYELREEFVDTAKKNLHRAGIFEYVDLKTGDVTEGIEEEDIDTVVLDLATPWLVVQHAYRTLKGSGIFVSFSPTIDQVVKTVEASRENNFEDIETIECFARRMQIVTGKVRPETLMTGHTGYITTARKAFK